MSKKQKTKYIFVLGGVMSGIGKGISVSSTGVILSHYGYKVNLMKADPYLNVDAGNMNPQEHGEVFVLESGLETDQDMGTYERFLNRNLFTEDYLTSGMVYKEVLEKERSLKYNGKCVEAIPHVVDLIIQKITKSAEKSKADVQIVEIGGTLGDYQNVLFIEAARRMKNMNSNEVTFALVSYVPFSKTLGEVKTKPTQSSIKLLNSYGISASILLVRSEIPLNKKYIEKISSSSDIPMKNIISVHDVNSIYEVVENLQKAQIAKILIEELDLPKRKSNNIIPKWKKFVKNVTNKNLPSITIGVVGKYFKSGEFILSDTYVSVIEAIKFSAASEGVRVNIEWIPAKDFEPTTMKKSTKETLEKLSGIIIPGGFGTNGVKGKLKVIKIARENGIPLLGICYGMQLMCVEFAQNILKKKNAHTIEVKPNTKDDVITIIEDQKNKLKENDFGGSMRLGAYKATLEKGSLIEELYNQTRIEERHRHRYEFNEKYVKSFEKAGFYVSARSLQGLVEAVELDWEEHPFFIGVQYHPEFTARPFNPNPLFTGLIKEAIKYKNTKKS